MQEFRLSEARIVNVSDLRVGDAISISGKEESAETILGIKKRSGYAPSEDDVVHILTEKGWTPVGRDSQILVIRRPTD